jgi:regulator of chromosome condensation
MSQKRPTSSPTEYPSNKRARRDSLRLNPAAQPLRFSHPVTVLVHGSPDFGQLGLGVDEVDEVTRPRLHKKVQELLLQSKQLGQHGVEQIVAGGMHSLLVDSEGKEIHFDTGV